MFFFTTFGVYVVKIIKIPANFTEKVLIGLVASNTVSTCLSLFFPINIYVLLSLVLLCLFLIFFIRKELKGLWCLLYENKRILFWSLPIIFIASLISLSSPMDWDTGLYHLQAIKWIEQYPVVPGLANLHSRFGFNPNIFTFFALTSLYDIFKQEIFSVNFVIFSVLVIYFVDKLFSLFKEQGLSNLFVFYSILLVVLLQCSYSLSSPAPDFLAQTMPLYIFARIIDLSAQKEKTEFKTFIPVLILIVYLLTVKLTAVPILLLFIFLLVKFRVDLKKSLWLLPLLCLIILPWIIRNIILTGWLIYPFPALDLFNFDWKVPLATVILEKQHVLSGSIDENMTGKFLFHLPIWWQKIGLIDKIIFTVSFAFPLIILTGQLIKKIKINQYKNAVIFISFSGLLFWLVMGPEFRFGIPYIVMAAASPLLYFRYHWKPKHEKNIVFNAIMVNFTILFVVIIFLGFFNMKGFWTLEMNTFKPLHFGIVKTPQKIKITESISFETFNINGIDIYVPSCHDCWDHCIPCAYYLDTTLVLRGETIKYGFKHTLKVGKQDKKTIDHIKNQEY